MYSRALILIAFIGIIIMTWVIYLYRNKYIKEEYALLWLAISIGITIISLRQDLLIKINLLIGAGNPTSLIMTAFIGFLIIISIFFSVRLSMLTEQNKKLIQEIALLHDKIRNINNEEK